MAASMEGPQQANPRMRRTTLGTQAVALLRKNVTYQKRNWATNLCLVSIPIIMCVLLAVLQVAINKVFDDPRFKCGCYTYPNGTQACGVKYSTSEQLPFCPVTTPPEWPAFMQVPKNQYRAVNEPPTSNYPDLPPPSCRDTKEGCANSIIYTGANKDSSSKMASFMIKPIPSMYIDLLSSPDIQSSLNDKNGQTDLGATIQKSLSDYVLGTSTYPSYGYLAEPAVTFSGWQAGSPIYLLQNNCTGIPNNLSMPFSLPKLGLTMNLSIQCTTTDLLWRESQEAINQELYNGYRDADTVNNPPHIEEYTAAYDFQNTDKGVYSPLVYYNSTKRNDSGAQGPPPQVIRISKSINLATNAYLKTFYGAELEVPLLFIKDFPKGPSTLNLDFSSLLGPLFYMWIIQLLFPVFTSALVYEKEKNLRMMMRMHGLGDGAYWLISYAYFLAVSIVYLAFFIIFGSIINLKFFRVNNYSIIIVFFFVFANTQIALSSLASTIFSNVKTATVVSYLYVFGSGLLGEFLFRFFLTDPNFPSAGILALELIPAFSLYRGLYELSQSAFIGNYQGTRGTLQWNNLGQYGFAAVLGILAVEWFIFLILGLYLDQVVSSGSGLKKPPLFFLKSCFSRKDKDSKRTGKDRKTEQAESLEVDGKIRPDVLNERETVENVLTKGNMGDYDGHHYSILCDNLQKIYPGRDGNPPKHAVRGMSLAVPRGECFGMLGPNGAGKSTSITMMIGFQEPSSGTAFIEGMDIRQEMDSIYSVMGVCPQHDLLWEQLSGREHLLFYGRLKNLKGKVLDAAVEESLKSVNLWNGGVGDKRCGTYSGGMKRRLSVAISLIGNPLVVYMDEPSTGLDPASRMNLWSVVKKAKRDRAIILTTHSMEEAEQLCDRLGIFVDGQFQCVGNPRELTARYGGTYVLTITTPIEQEQSVQDLAKSLTPNAKCVYSLAGTQKFELPVNEVDVADVFASIEESKVSRGLKIQAWGIANTTLEDVFIRIATEAQAGLALV